jgi:hypothetical protein
MSVPLNSGAAFQRKIKSSFANIRDFADNKGKPLKTASIIKDAISTGVRVESLAPGIAE